MTNYYHCYRRLGNRFYFENAMDSEKRVCFTLPDAESAEMRNHLRNNNDMLYMIPDYERN